MVMVEDKDEDRYLLTVEQAIEACGAHNKEKRAIFKRQFENLQAHLGQLTSERKGKVKKVFLTIRDAGLLFLLVTQKKTYDQDFEAELTRLDLEVANSCDFSEIQMSVQALPLCDEDNYYSFCNPEWTLEYKSLNAK
jgi:hypothetical protein